MQLPDLAGRRSFVARTGLVLAHGLPGSEGPAGPCVSVGVCRGGVFESGRRKAGFVSASVADSVSYQHNTPHFHLLLLHVDGPPIKLTDLLTDCMVAN